MKKYVLETTPLDRNTSKTETLLLGNWCNLDGENRGFKAVDYHWDDRKQLHLDHKRIFSLYEIYLNQLTISLNKIHHVEHTVHYWRIIVGPWLYYFICIAFDRYQMLFKASTNYTIEYTLEPRYDSDSWIPLDYEDFKYKFYSDEWNYYIFSEINKYTNLINKKNTNCDLLPRMLSKNDKQHWSKKISKGFLFFLSRLTNKYLTKVLFVEIGAPQIYMYKLLFKLKTSPFSYFIRVRPKSFYVNHSMRDKLNDSNSVCNNEFEKLLTNLIPGNIPISYIEGYSQLVRESNNIFPKKTSLIVTANAYFSNEHFKTWAARQKERGAILWIMVHGGHHGTALFNGPGKLTEDIADRFYSWGWGKYNLPSYKLSLLKGVNLTKSSNRILFIPYSLSKYSNHIDASPISSTFNSCLEMQFRFFNELTSCELIDNLFIRIKDSQQIWNLQYEYMKYGIKNFILSDSETILNSIRKSSLVIVTFDSTVFLETLTLNTPTCLFINENLWEMSLLSERHFKKFLECGILHFNEKNLAEHIVNNQHNYDEWWQSDVVQDSIQDFLLEFGYSSNNWQKEWFDEVNNALSSIDINIHSSIK
jgi:putative transferase (TIGR04331 family)